MPMHAPNMGHYGGVQAMKFGGMRPPMLHHMGQPFTGMPLQGGFPQQVNAIPRRNSEGGNNTAGMQNANASMGGGNYAYAAWMAHAQNNPQAYVYATQVNSARQDDSQKTTGKEANAANTNTKAVSGNSGGNTKENTSQAGTGEKDNAKNETEIPVRLVDPNLPPGWAAWFVRGKPFYQNLQTKKTTWRRPPPPEPITTPSAPTQPPSQETANTNASLEAPEKQTPTSEKNTPVADSGGGDTKDDSKSKQNVRPRPEALAEKEAFMKQVAEVVRKGLSRYRDEKCPKGRITCNDDFKYVARKITHIVVEKHKRAHPDYVFKESTARHVRHFLADFMGKQGPVYVRKTKETRSPSASE
eukprot:comp15960_c2_seq1/m.13365 comp15960_c2_seq1/g.13365  ORF comp15960_c2_seq1/g.13365 comp15960_c2_seq1/m.13365 type:complete len:357 (-) comp15960_c2_seq1:17-1087(-)